MREFDAIVIGVGGMGSAAVYHLARRGWRVLGLEQYDIPNEMGSSHGISRMIRLAYHEDPSYVPLLYRAYELWHQLENTAGEKLARHHRMRARRRGREQAAGRLAGDGARSTTCRTASSAAPR